MDHEDMIENEMEVEIEDEMADGDEHPTTDSENTSHELLDFPFSIPGIKLGELRLCCYSYKSFTFSGFEYNATSLNTTEEDTAEKILDFHTNMYDEKINVTPNIPPNLLPIIPPAPARTTSTFKLTKISAYVHAYKHVLMGCRYNKHTISSYDLRTGLKTKTNSISWNPMEAFNFTTIHIRHAQNERSIEDYVSTVLDVDYSPTGEEITSNSVDSKFLLSVSDDGNVRLWKASKKLGATFIMLYENRKVIESGLIWNILNNSKRDINKDLPRSDVLQDSSDEGSETATRKPKRSNASKSAGGPTRYAMKRLSVKAVTAYEKPPIKDIPLNMKTPSYTQRDQVYAAEETNYARRTKTKRGKSHIQKSEQYRIKRERKKKIIGGANRYKLFIFNLTTYFL
ncbi:7439_t:CDS:10 [Paraglomus brasilianum]|uniref:7439_t:CDS:1 n=1 Tax=Paraglomus brasilianum TaxID=144538 RepID=A0A9N9BYY3_9GLOM|nr:7439_t:CDS:10 [Paraglomus brasilianum]